MWLPVKNGIINLDKTGNNKTGNHEGYPNEGYPNRRSIRLKGYDYSQPGLYFITIVTKNREYLFGNIKNGKMILNDAGKMVETEWLKIPQRFKNIKLHEYTVMPNHFHAILEIVSVPQNSNIQNNIKITVGATLVVARNNKMVAHNDEINNTQNEQPRENGQPPENGQPQGIAPTGKTVGDMVGAFESITTVEYIRGVKNNNWQPFNKKLWQRNYWEHIIRNENEYNRISQYIIDNPAKWENDKLNGGDGNIIMEPSAEYNSEIWMV